MQTVKIGRQFRAEPQDFTGSGVFNDQYMGMQGLSAKGLERGLGGLWQKRRFGPKSRAVDIITHERMPDRGQMNANLVGTTGFQSAGKETGYRLPPAAAFRAAGAPPFPPPRPHPHPPR